jgi:cytochrome P450
MSSALGYHPLSEIAHGDAIWPVFARMRAEAPALYLEEFDCWFLSRFADIWDLLPSPALSTARGMTTVELLLRQRALEIPPGEGGLAAMDPPRHTELRALLARHFTPGAARRLEPLARELVRGFIADVRERGRADAIADLAMRLSVRIACAIIGIPFELADRLAGDVNQFFDRADGVTGTTETGQRATERLMGAIAELIGRHRSGREAGDTLIGELLTAEPGGKPLGEISLLGTLQLLVVGGTETLPKVFAAALHRLWQHPDQRADVAADPALVPGAFWEALRYDMPTQMLGRTLVAPVELHGQTLRAGQKVMFLWPSANRDEREFEAPERFNVRRNAPRILSFGQATHRCLGAHIAQMEGRVLLEEWLRFAPRYEVLETQAVRLRSEFFRGFSALPIAF